MRVREEGARHIGAAGIGGVTRAKRCSWSRHEFNPDSIRFEPIKACFNEGQKHSSILS
jgi:hypothetical protein